MDYFEIRRNLLMEHCVKFEDVKDERLIIRVPNNDFKNRFFR